MTNQIIKVENRKFIYCPSGKNGFDNSFCHKPTPFNLSDEILRVYFGVRDDVGKTRTTFVDLDQKNPEKILKISEDRCFEDGKIGAFDDSGSNVCSVLKVENEYYMYYIGWNPSTTVHTRNSIGIVFSDNGKNFFRRFDGSIVDRDKEEPYYTGAVDVMYEDGIFKMWYTSGSEWKIINNKPEIFYHIKYAESNNGIDWNKKGVFCIPPIHDYEATARPSVFKHQNKYIMLYSKRDLREFRHNSKFSYRAGIAISDDGINWVRKDEFLDFSPSEQGWDDSAIAYPYANIFQNSLRIFYNGNGFGKTGFGFAELKLDELEKIF